MFFDAFATRKAVLLFRLVVIKLMFDSFEDKTHEYFVKQTVANKNQPVLLVASFWATY